MKPEISVVIPVYKSVPFLKGAVDSVLSQTYFAGKNDRFEILIVIDGECDDLSDKVPLASNIKILQIKHRGVSGARNHGIENAQASRFVAFLDSDDSWLPAKIEKQVALAEKLPKAGLIYSNSFLIGKTGKVLRRTQKEQYGRLPSGKVFKDMMERDFPVTSTMLIRKEVFDTVGFFDTRLEVCEDWEFKIRISKSYEFAAVDEPLIYYRLHAGGTHYKCEKMLECGYKVFDTHVRSLEGAGPLNGDILSLKANIALNLAGSWLYIDRTQQAREFLRESMKFDKKNPRLYLMYLLSLLPKGARDLALAARDRIPFLP